MVMRNAMFLVAGIIAGSGLILLGSHWTGRNRSSTDGVVPPKRSASVRGLRRALTQAREEIGRVRSELAMAHRVSSEIPEGDNVESHETRTTGGIPAENTVLSMEDRLASVGEALEAFEADPRYREIFARHSRDEGAFPGWDPVRFLEDPDLNPRGLKLSEDERREFELFYALARQRAKTIDLKRHLAQSEAISAMIEERLGEASNGNHPDGPGEVRVVHLPGNLKFSLPLSEFPEIGLLEDERRLAVYEWFIEAREYFASIE